MVLFLAMLTACGDVDESTIDNHTHEAPSVIREDLGGCVNDPDAAAYWMWSDGHGLDAVPTVYFCDTAMAGTPGTIEDHGAPCQPVSGNGRVIIYESGAMAASCTSGEADGETAWYEVRWVAP